MGRKSLLYASPFLPVQSGISAYSSVLVRGLAEYFDVTLLIDDYEISDAGLRERFPILRNQDARDAIGTFDHRLYNVGNQPYYHGYIYDCALRWPGTVILHDVVLYYLVVGYYRGREDFYSKVYALEGPLGIELVKQQLKAGHDLLRFRQPERLPFNGEIVAASERVLVHSRYAYDRLATIPGVEPKLAVLPMVDVMGTNDSPVVERSELFGRFGIPEDCLVVASFGFVAPTKLNHEVCEAVRGIGASDGPVCYVMVGEGSYVDAYLDGRVHKTGYVSDEEFRSFMVHADLVVNLREPSMGESSASLLMAMASGRACAVNDVPWFSDLPDEVVVKIDNSRRRDELVRVIAAARSDGWRATIGRRAADYASREHSLGTVSRTLFELLEGGNDR